MANFIVGIIYNYQYDYDYHNISKINSELIVS